MLTKYEHCKSQKLALDMGRIAVLLTVVCPLACALIRGCECLDCCRQPLGIETGTIEDHQMTASSAFQNDYVHFGAQRGRLHRVDWPPGFRANFPLPKDEPEWLRIDLGRTVIITGVATQGYGDERTAEWVTLYRLAYARNAKIYYSTDEEGKPQDFKGNFDSNTVQRNELKYPVSTSIVILKPKQWHNNIGLRLELYGCQPGHYFVVWLILIDKMFNVRHLDRRSIEYQTASSAAQTGVQALLTKVPGFLYAKVGALNPQVSQSMQSDVAAEIEIYCTQSSMQRVVTDLDGGLKKTDKNKVFDPTYMELQYPLDCSCHPPLVHVHLNKSIERAKLVLTTQNKFGFSAEVRSDCNETQKLIRYWEIAKVNADSGFFSILFTYTKESQSVQLETKTFGQGYLYIRHVSRMLGIAGTISYDYGFIHITHPPSLVVEIHGPSSISPMAAEHAILNASSSYDPAEKHRGSRGLVFSWYCWQQGFKNLSAGFSKRISQGVGGCFGKVLDAGSVLVVPVNELKEKTSYTFLVTAEKDIRVANATHVLQVEGISLHFRCLENCAKKVSLHARLILAVVCVARECNEEYLQYNWTLYVPRNTSGVNKWESLVKMTGNVTTGTNTSRFVIPQPRDVLAWMSGDTLKTRVEVLHRGERLVYANERVFTLNTPPRVIDTETEYNGCLVSPKEDEALTGLFNISCSGWIDEDVPLTYEFRYEFISSTIIIQSGNSSSTSAILPLGNSNDDYKLYLEVEIRDAFGDPTIHRLQAKAKPPAVSDMLVNVILSAEKDIKRYIEDGKVDKAAEMSCAVLSLLNVDDKLDEQTKVKEKILHSVAGADIRNIAQTSKVAAIVAIATNKTDGLHNNMQDDALTLIDKSMSFIESERQGGTLTQNQNIDKTLLVGLGNVLSKSSQDARAATPDQHGTKQMSRNLAERSLLLTARIGDDLLEDAANCENPEVIITKLINITVCRDDAHPEKRQRLKQGHHEIVFPPMSELFKGYNISSMTYVDVKVSAFEKNPYTWDASYKLVQSSVLDVTIKDPNGTIMSFPNLTKPVLLIIDNPLRRSEKKMLPPQEHLFVKPYIEEQWMRYHMVYISSDKLTVSINVTSQDNYPLDIYVRYGERPNLKDYAYKTTLPNTSSCVWSSKGNVCGSNPYSFDISSAVTGHIGRHFIGIIYSRSNLPQGITRRSLCGGRAKGRQKRACVGVKDPPTPLPQSRTIAPEYNASSDVNYTLTVSMGTCLYWNEEEIEWTTKGCRLSADKYRVTGKVHCLCDHLSSFGGDFFVAPNPIDFDKVFAEFGQLGKTGNFVVLATVCIVFGLYIIGLILARRLDKKDEDKTVLNVALSDGTENPTYAYELSIQTGAWKNCGTTANIGIILYGENGCTGPICLTPFDLEKTLFARGSINTFTLYVTRSLGDLFKLKIWHDDSGENPSWFLHDVVITDPQTRDKWHFLWNRWVALDKGKGNLEVDIKAATNKQLSSFQSIFYSRGAKNLGEAHLYLSLFTKPPHSTFTRCQRLTCCLSILFTAMIVNAMFYRSDEDHADSFQVGPINISWTQIKIGLQSGLIAVPVNVLIVAIFRNIKHQPASDHHEIDNLTLKWLKESGQENVGDTKDKSSGCFPHVFVYVAWGLGILASLASAAFIVFYSLMWGKDTSNRWLTSVMISFVEDIIVIQPTKVIGIVVLLSLIFRKPIGHDPVHGSQKKKKKKQVDGAETVALPSEEELEKIRCYRLNRSKMIGLLLDIGFFVIFLLLLMIVCYGNRDTTRYRLTKSVLDVFHGFDEVGKHGSDDFWKWIKSTLIPGLYDVKWYNGQAFKYREGFISNREEFLVGMPRLRQIRIKPDPKCMIEEQQRRFAQTFLRCLPQYSYTTEDKTLYNAPAWIPVNSTSFKYMLQLNRLCPTPWRYKTSEELGSLSFTGSRNTYTGGGYVAVLGYNSLTASGVVESLEQNGWIDDRTAAVFIEFTTYEPASSLFNSAKFVYESFPNGGSTTVTKSRTLNLYSAANVRFRLFYQTCHLFFMIVVVLSFAIEVSRGYRQGWSYFKGFWNCCNLVLLFSTISSTVMFFLKESFTSDFVKKVNENPFETWSMDSIMMWSDLEVYLLSFVIFLVTLKMLALLRFNRHIVQMKTTLLLASSHMVSFSIVFIIMMLAYVQLGTLLFSVSVTSYSSFVQSLRSVLQMMIGGKAPFFKLQTANSILGPLFVFVYMMSMIWVLLSMFMAILNDAYTESREAGIDELEDIKLANFMKAQVKDGCESLKYSILSLLGLRTSMEKYRLCDQESEATHNKFNRESNDIPKRSETNQESSAAILLASVETLDEENPESLEDPESKLTEEERTLRELKGILSDLAEDLRATLPRLDYEAGCANKRWSILSCSYDDWKRYSCSSLIGEYKRPREASVELQSSDCGGVSDGSEESVLDL